MSPVAIVTASDSGIGQESAKELAQNGFDVGITYHEDEAGARETLEFASRVPIILRVTAERRHHGLFGRGTPIWRDQIPRIVQRGHEVR